MLKTIDELGIKPIEGKFLSPDIKKLNGVLVNFKSTPISKSFAIKLIDDFSEVKKTNKNTDIQLVMNKLERYVFDFKWDDSDKDVIQRMVNYSVAYFIKTKEVTDSPTVIKHLDRWLYTKGVIDESPFKETLKLNSFNRLNSDLLNILIERYK